MARHAKSTFRFTNDHLIKIREYPHLLGNLIGKDKLKEIHSEWITYAWDDVKHKSLQAHRGSYKTTAITIVGAIWWLLFNPNDRIAIVRKGFTDASDCVKSIRSAFQLPILCGLFEYAHGLSPKLFVKRDARLTFNFKRKSTPEGSIDAYGLETNLTGKHYDKIITDDIITLKDRISSTEREKTKEFVREMRTNIIDPGKSFVGVGTPWHKLDAWGEVKDSIEVMPRPIKKYSIMDCDILNEEEIQQKKSVTTPSLFAANYLLQHMSSEESIFKEPFFKEWNYSYEGRAHLDAKYWGTDTNALTIMAKKPDGRIQAVGFTFNENVKEKYGFIYHKWLNYRTGTMYNESNADKAFLADELSKMGIPVQSYHESMNKHVKITSWLLKYWNLIDWDYRTDDEYLCQIVEYIEGASVDDAPDSAASLLREMFNKSANFLSQLVRD